MKMKIILTRDLLRSIARYEMTFRDFSEDGEFDPDGFTVPAPYQITLDDLRAALTAVKKKRITVGEFAWYWLYPVDELDYGKDYFGLIDAFIAENDGDLPEGIRCIPDFLITAGDYFRDIWQEMIFTVEEEEDENALLEDVIDIDSMLKQIRRYNRNRGKPLENRDYTDIEKECCISELGRDDRSMDLTEQELALCRTFTEELCRKENRTALTLKAYACYGGNRLYPCDWDMSRQYLEKLYERYTDTNAANSLGYINYYGRCTDGEPDYDRAFGYFTAAAACDHPEGLYKLGDMFMNGYGCRKNTRAAANLYQRAMNVNSLKFMIGNNVSALPDACLRMGDLYSKGTRAEKDPKEAYYYCTLGAYASRIRLQHSDFFGYKETDKKIAKALEEARERLPEDYFRPYLDLDTQEDLDILLKNLKGPFDCELTRIEKGGKKMLKIKLHRPKDMEEDMRGLVCYPELDICERAVSVTLEIIQEKEWTFAGGKKTVLFDSLFYNGKTGSFDFCYGSELTARVRAKALRLNAAKKKTQKPVQPAGEQTDFLK